MMFAMRNNSLWNFDRQTILINNKTCTQNMYTKQLKWSETRYNITTASCYLVVTSQSQPQMSVAKVPFSTIELIYSMSQLQSLGGNGPLCILTKYNCLALDHFRMHVHSVHMYLWEFRMNIFPEQITNKNLKIIGLKILQHMKLLWCNT